MRAPPLSGADRRIGRGSQIVVSILVLVITAIYVDSIFGFHENWPFTSNTMFAYYRTPETPLYDLRIALVDSAGHARRLHGPRDLGFPGTEGFRRLIFSQYYGSTDANFPQGHEVDPSPSAMTARLTDLCHRLFGALRRPQGIAAITMEIDRMAVTVDTQTVAQRYPLGQCVATPNAPFVPALPTPGTP